MVAIPLDAKDIEKKDLLIEFFSDVSFPTKLSINMGEDIQVIGYPLGLYYDDVFNLPVNRSGILASAYPVPFQGKPHFLIDARLHKGTSGSPVITKLKNLMETLGPGQAAGRLHYVLLGVNSSTADFHKDTEFHKDAEPLGLNAAVFASIVQTITNDSTCEDVPQPRNLIGFDYALAKGRQRG